MPDSPKNLQTPAEAAFKKALTAVSLQDFVLDSIIAAQICQLAKTKKHRESTSVILGAFGGVGEI